MFLALALCLTRDESDPLAIPARPEPSPLVAAILARQIGHLRAIIALVKAGASQADLDRANEESAERIRRDLIEPHGEAGWVAADDAADRMLVFIRALGDE